MEIENVFRWQYVLYEILVNVCIILYEMISIRYRIEIFRSLRNVQHLKHTLRHLWHMYFYMSHHAFDHLQTDVSVNVTEKLETERKKK